MEKKCLKCGKLHDGNYGSGKYCNVKCANSRVRTEEVKKKISEGVKKSKSWEKIKLEVDHIDGDKYNNSRENLRLLCPNCHSTTPTWRKPKQR